MDIRFLLFAGRLSSDGGSSLGTRSVKSDVNVDAIAACDKLLDLVPQCAGFLGDSPFTDACIYDVDQIQNPGLATTIIDSYALKCLELANAAGVHIGMHFPSFPLLMHDRSSSICGLFCCIWTWIGNNCTWRQEHLVYHPIQRC